MTTAIALLTVTLRTFIDVLQLMLLARAIMSWIPNLNNSRLADFLYIVTDWVIEPVRCIYEFFGGGKLMLPIDIPFLLTYILLSVIGMLL